MQINWLLCLKVLAIWMTLITILAISKETNTKNNLVVILLYFIFISLFAFGLSRKQYQPTLVIGFSIGFIMSSIQYRNYLSSLFRSPILGIHFS